jgi:hypothetical protein
MRHLWLGRPLRIRAIAAVFALAAAFLGGEAMAQQDLQPTFQDRRHLEQQLRDFRKLQDIEELRDRGVHPRFNEIPATLDGRQMPEGLGLDTSQRLPQTESLQRESEALLQGLEARLVRKLLNPGASGAMSGRLSKFRPSLEERLQMHRDDPGKALLQTVADYVPESFVVTAQGIRSVDRPVLSNEEVADLLRASQNHKVSLTEYHDFLRKALGANARTPVLELFGLDGFPLGDTRYFSIIGKDDIQKMIVGQNGVVGMTEVNRTRLLPSNIFGMAPDCDGDESSDGQRPTCPGEGHIERIKRMAGAVALITGSSFLYGSKDNIRLGLRPAEHCRFQSRSHCSGFLDADRQHLWTAAHCLTNLNLIETPGAGRSALPEVGETTPCPAGARFRAIFGLGARQHDEQPLATGAVYGCRAVTRTGHDTVRIRLDTDTGVPEGLVAVGMPVHPDPSAAAADIPAGTRLVGFGFPHTARLARLNNGAVRPPSFCAATVASNSVLSDDNPLPVDHIRPEADYLCISTDTLSGASGGPVIAALPNERVAVVGVVSRAYRVELAEECRGTSEESDRLNLASRIFPLKK